MIQTHNRTGIIVLTFVAAMGASIIPLPDWAAPFRPAFVLLTLIYWCLALPKLINIGAAWLLGMMQDVLVGTLLGQHALSYAVVAFIAVKLHQQIRVYPLWQQALSIFTLVALAQLLNLWVLGIIGQSPDTWIYWMQSFTSALLWPWVFIILRDIRRKFGVT